MSLDFYLTSNQHTPNQLQTNQTQPMANFEALNLGMTYSGFDNLRANIETIANGNPLLDVKKHPGLIAYQKAMDNEDLLTTNQCLDLYTILKSSAFDDLEQTYSYHTLLSALHAAAMNQMNLMWM